MPDVLVQIFVYEIVFSSIGKNLGRVLIID